MTKATKPLPWTAPNIFLISILRQPVKLIALAMLVGLAAFGITLRATEYIVVRSEMARLEGHYRPIGFLAPFGAEWPPLVYSVIDGVPDGLFVYAWEHDRLDFEDYTWQDLISSDSRVDFVDRRRRYIAEFADIPNASVRGSSGLIRALGIYETDAFFTATLLEGSHIWQMRRDEFGEVSHGTPVAGVGEYLVLYLTVDEVFLAYPEHVQEGQHLRLLVPIIDAYNMPTDGMVVGNTYLIRAWFHHFAYISIHDIIEYSDILYVCVMGNLRTTPGRDPSRSPTKESYPVMIIAPLHSSDDIYFWDTNSDDYAQVLDGLAGLIEEWNHRQRELFIKATVDGSASYVTQGFSDYRLLAGRWTNYQDYLDANPVAAIYYAFAAVRGLDIGDIISITPRRQQGSDLILQLEVVGIYDRGNLGSVIRNVPSIQVPTSLSLSDSEFEHLARIYPHFDSYYSFVLNSPRDQAAFAADIGPYLFAMGYVLAFIPTNADVFIATADPIMQTMTVNLIVFAVSGIAALLLAAFIYIRLAEKNFALQRALGIPARTALYKIFTPVIVFWLPVIIVGAVGAWFAALNLAEANLAPLFELEPHMAMGDDFSIMPLVWVASGTIAAALAAVAAMTLRLTRPVLQLLQKMDR
ncbi:MAG: hypothetical protein FWC77_06125 [Defluviitaleaceae bacterium]|nr:hypothetical protein [Defluviitaleaceae bacterium]